MSAVGASGAKIARHLAKVLRGYGCTVEINRRHLHIVTAEGKRVTTSSTPSCGSWHNLAARLRAAGVPIGHWKELVP